MAEDTVVTTSLQMNQVHSELRLARSLIAERDSEIQQLHVTNNQVRSPPFYFLNQLIVSSILMFISFAFNECERQYVKENERLRSILNEWSARAAKVQQNFHQFIAAMFLNTVHS